MFPLLNFLTFEIMLNIQIYRKGDRVSAVISPSPRNRYKCDISLRNRGLIQDQVQYQSYVSGMNQDQSIKSKEDIRDLQSLLRESWKSKVTFHEYLDYVPGNFIKIDDRVHLIHKREGRHLYCITLTSKEKVRITEELKIEVPKPDEVNYFLENSEIEL